MDNYDINAYSSDEERRPQIFRHRANYFEEYDEQDFLERFRLSKRSVENVLEEIGDLISHPTNRNHCLSASQQLLLTLNFYANGSFLRTTADFCGVSKATACRVVRRVSVAIASLRPRYIKMPENDEIAEIRQKFYDIARFPRCIGALDCTHVRLQSPGGDNAEIFRHRKQFFSLNVQTVSDPDLKIRNVVARWPGSAHDSNIFRNSQLCAEFEMGQYGDGLLVGDSGYPIKNYLITPLHQVQNAVEALFNESLIRTRNVVERQYGVWKRRFPSLAMGLRVGVDTAQAIIVATGILHNIACDENERLPHLNEEQEAVINFVNNVQIQNGEHIAGLNQNNRERFNLIHNYFATL